MACFPPRIYQKESAYPLNKLVSENLALFGTLGACLRCSGLELKKAKTSSLCANRSSNKTACNNAQKVAQVTANVCCAANETLNTATPPNALPYHTNKFESAHCEEKLKLVLCFVQSVRTDRFQSTRTQVWKFNLVEVRRNLHKRNRKGQPKKNTCFLFMLTHSQHNAR